MARIIEVVPYDIRWPSLFDAEAALVGPVFGDRLVEMHHMGSTSVPGMHAKPIIDILAEVVTGTEITDHYPAMSALGYDCRGECLDATIPGTQGRFYFSKNIGGKRYSQVHVCHVGHWQAAELLCLRDYLRDHPNDARRYGELKVRLAAQHREDGICYMRGKDGLVKELIMAAKGWRAAGLGRA